MFKNFILIEQVKIRRKNNNVLYKYIYKNKHTRLIIKFVVIDNIMYNIILNIYNIKRKQGNNYYFPHDDYSGPAKYKDFINSIILTHIL